MNLHQKDDSENIVLNVNKLRANDFINIFDSQWKHFQQFKEKPKQFELEDSSLS